MLIYILLLATLIIAFYITMIQLSSKKVVAIGCVLAGNNNIEAKIEFDQSDRKQLYAFALLYASKIKWVILTDPPLSLKIFRNVFNNTIAQWPEVPYVEMVASLEEEKREYKIELYKIKDNWSITTHLPSNGFAGDLVTQYFIFLKEIVSKLSQPEKEKLGEMLKKYSNECGVMNSANEGMWALASEQKFINKMLKEV